jgi:ATP-dependent helicase HrpB
LLQRRLAGQLQTVLQSGFDTREQAVVARRQVRLGALVLTEQAVALQGEQIRQAMVAALQERGLQSLPWEDASRALLARLRFARPAEGDWPAFDEHALLAGLDDWLGPQLEGITRLSQLSRLRLVDALLSRLDYRQQQQLEQRAPTHLTVPTGTRVRIDYEDESAPCIEVRLQEVFGLAETPRIAGGRVVVTLKLLSPARRPVQITRDLGGFWRGSYAEVRKDLRGRYPRHYWPEDPLQAEPTRGVRRPRD